MITLLLAGELVVLLSPTGSFHSQFPFSLHTLTPSQPFRLSELPNVTVAIIEAGDSVYNNVNVTNPALYGDAFGTSIDYAYPTTNQVYADDKSAPMRAGKALGGTSTINGTQSTISVKS